MNYGIARGKLQTFDDLKKMVDETVTMEDGQVRRPVDSRRHRVSFCVTKNGGYCEAAL